MRRLINEAIYGYPSLVRFFRGRLFNKKWNVILDKRVRPIQRIETYLQKYNKSLSVSTFNCSSDSFWHWLRSGKSQFLNMSYPHKKALEFFYSAMLLHIIKEDIVLDAAGGRSEYLSIIKETTGCKRLYVTDQIYSSEIKETLEMITLGGDVTAIRLPDESVTKIACHHAFEHFRGEKDSRFIFEIARLLTPKGQACIIPLFVSDCYAEVWNKPPENHYDRSALCVVDRTSSLPGGDDDGHFARIYDIRALIERILSPAQRASLTPRIVECKMDSQTVPDMSINFGSHINRPLRALLLEKV